MAIDLTSADEWSVAFVVVLAFVLGLELAYRLGRRHASRVDKLQADHVKSLQAALLGLLALLLGFNFAMASSRYDARKALTQDEVNSVANVWLRAQLLAPPLRAEVAALVERYVATRVAFAQAGDDPAKAHAANDASTAVEKDLWRAITPLTQATPRDLLAAPLVQAIIDMNNVRWKRLFAIDNHLPEPAIYLLIFVALLSLAFIAYGYGLAGRRRHLSTAIFAVAIALVLAAILDFDRPRTGFIRVGEDGMVRLQHALETY